MSVPDYTGYWTGKIEGTNQGGLTLNIHQKNEIITGIAKLSEPALGEYEYIIQGLSSENLSLNLIPGRQSGGFNRLLAVSSG